MTLLVSDQNQPRFINVALIALTAAVAASQYAHAQEAGFADEIGVGYDNTVMLQRLTVYMDGEEVIETEGSLFVTLRDGSSHYIDLEELEDPDGNRYMVVGDAFQDAEDAPVVYETQLVRVEPRILTDMEVEGQFLELHPEASVAEVEEFMYLRDEAAQLQVPSRYIEPEIDEWLDHAIAGEEIDLVLVFEEQEPLDLPQLEAAFLEDEPALWLAASEERLLEIETRKTALYGIQDSFLGEYAALGVSNTRNFWIFNGVKATFYSAAVEALLDDDRIARLEVFREANLSADNTGAEIIEATQMKQFLDAGFDGHRYSYRCPWVSDIYAMIFDSSITQDHVAWRDGVGTDSRLISVYYDRWGTGYELTNYTTKETDEVHGNVVATQFVSDLTDGQDSNYTTESEQLKKTGMTTETVFTFVMSGFDGSVVEAAELAIAFGVDVINFSTNSEERDEFCDANHSQAIAINNMMHNGIFVVNSAGNEANAFPGICNVGPPATASGAFTVAAYEKGGHPVTEELNEANIASFSSHGPDVNGRPLVQMTASSGREGEHVVSWENPLYIEESRGGTSYSAPIVAGAVANLKDFFIHKFGVTLANKVGLLFANMLIMGDGKIEDGVQTPTTPIDPRWGAGRLRMRMFNGAGMDTPWRHRWAYHTLSQSEVFEIPVNPIAGTNEPVSENVEFFRAALWFHEPNLGEGVNSSVVSFLINEDGTSNTYLCSSAAPQSQRLFLEEEIRNKAWTVKVGGQYLPASIDVQDPWYGETKRRVFVAMYFEDRSRDDPDGPGWADDIW